MFLQLIQHVQANPTEKVQVLSEKISELENSYHHYKFKSNLDFANQEGVEERFFKLLKIKAMKANLFATNIISCDFINNTASGFVRKIIQKGAQTDQKDGIVESVFIDEVKKIIVFVQEMSSGKFRMTEVNRIDKENDTYILVGKYVFEILKDSKSAEDVQAIEKLKECMPDLSQTLVDNLGKYYVNENVEQIYQTYYKA